MFGCDSRAVACASRSNISSVRARSPSSRGTLIATSRLSRRSYARYTVAIPPAASRSRSS
jgi:hypothetical protein